MRAPPALLPGGVTCASTRHGRGRATETAQGVTPARADCAAMLQAETWSPEGAMSKVRLLEGGMTPRAGQPRGLRLGQPHAHSALAAGRGGFLPWVRPSLQRHPSLLRRSRVGKKGSAGGLRRAGEGEETADGALSVTSRDSNSLGLGGGRRSLGRAMDTSCRCSHCSPIDTAAGGRLY